MDVENELMIRKEYLPGIRETVRDFLDQGYQWLAWRNYSGYLHPDLMHGFPLRKQAEDFCWAPDNPALRWDAMSLKDFNEALTDTVSHYKRAGEIPAFFGVNIKGMDRVEPEKTFRQERYDGIKQQLKMLGVTIAPEQIKDGVLKNKDGLVLTTQVMQDYHPLEVGMVFRKKETGNYALENLEVSGILVPSLIIGGVNLDDLQKRMSRIKFSSSHPNSDEIAIREKAIDDLKKVKNASRGKPYAEAIWIKYKDSTYPDDPYYARDPRREDYETRMVFPWNKEKPMTIAEAGRLFVGQSEDKHKSLHVGRSRGR